MSGHKLPSVKHALQVLRSNAARGAGPLTRDEVSALEACANSQAELLGALKALWSVSSCGPKGQYRPEVDRAAAAIAKAEGES